MDTNKIMVVTQEPIIMQSNKDILCNNNQNIIMQSSKIKIECNNNKKIGCNTRTNHVAIQVKHFAKIWSYQMISCKVKPKLKDQKSQCNICCMRTCNSFSWGVCWVLKMSFISITLSLLCPLYHLHFTTMSPHSSHFHYHWATFMFFQSLLILSLLSEFVVKN